MEFLPSWRARFILKIFPHNLHPSKDLPFLPFCNILLSVLQQ
ncbi:hypothetical protein SELSPUOL_00943 [Selenomonas sputigena ATCC 35185]|uniref:Uncharacterized protein n=1 Tax=Selenomonas sputigena (strain ATCC 35185 / DSM 20758 / CCUG 44933 / VPI D19B-28) TaxID=546271 RepID=C9LUD6_SELS3|nr:hypothetical protein SELSPUOL_00943 [Selenomonas sputigena ATCC 35185]